MTGGTRLLDFDLRSLEPPLYKNYKNLWIDFQCYGVFLDKSAPRGFWKILGGLGGALEGPWGTLGSLGDAEGRLGRPLLANRRLCTIIVFIL